MSNDTADLTNAEVGDVLHLRRSNCGSAVIEAVAEDRVCSRYCWWRKDGRMYENNISDLDVLRLEKRRPVRLVPDVVFGMSVPGNEPVPTREEEYVPLTADEIGHYYCINHRSYVANIRAARRAGWFKRRTEVES